MTWEELFLRYADLGFAYLVALFLLWRGHIQDREYLKALQELTTILKEHVRQKDEALTMLREDLDCYRARLLGDRRYSQDQQ